MKTTTYICDVCNKSVSEKELVGIEVSTENILFGSESGYSRSKARLEICKDCLRKKGFVIQTITKDNKEQTITQNSKTLESKIIDILEDIGVSFVE